MAISATARRATKFISTASGARNTLGVIGPTPVLLLEQNQSSVFTSPQITLNTWARSPSTANSTSIRNGRLPAIFTCGASEQHHTDGNDADIQNCSDNSIPNSFSGSLCLDSGNFPAVTNGNAFVILGSQRQPIPFSDTAVYGTIDRTSVHATTFGTALQATDNDKFFGHQNYLTFGASVDRSLLSFNATSQLGNIYPDFVIANGRFPRLGHDHQHRWDEIGYVPTYLTGNTTYYGVYALDTFNITPELALTAGGRLNIAQIVTEDVTGPSAGTQHQQHFFADQSGRRSDL